MKMNIAYEGGKKFNVKVRDHEIAIDLPEKLGGEDTAPTPPEMLIASLGSCIGVFALGYLAAAKFDATGLSIEMDWDFSIDHKRVSKANAKVTVPNADLGPKKKALIRAMEQCVIHNTLHEAPEMTIEVA